MRTRDEIESELARLREKALAKVVPRDEQSSELHAWLALAWALGPEVQRAELDKLIDHVTVIEGGALVDG